MAVENIIYRNDIKPSARVQLESYLKGTARPDLSSFYISETDLNGDGINEIIMRVRDCDSRNVTCLHLILALPPQKVVMLGEINARKLMLAGTYSGNVKDILAFRNDKNDYDYDVYFWDPVSEKYNLERQEIGN